MKKYLVFLMSLCALVMIASCGKDEENLNGTIHGLVTDFTNANTPVAGSTVTLASKGLTKTTGSDGRFEFGGIEPGTYTIQVAANGYQTTTKQVTVYAGQTAMCDFQLTKGTTSIEINPQTLTFGRNIEQLAFTITNNSTRSLTYTISNAPDFVEVTPVSGTVVSQGRQAVSVHVLNRSSIATNRTGQLTVNIGNDSYIVSIAVTNSTTTDPEQGGDTPGGSGSTEDIAVTNGLFAYYTFENSTTDVTEQRLVGIGSGASFVDSYNGTSALYIPSSPSAKLTIPNSLIDQNKMSVSFWVKDLQDGHIFHAVRNYNNKAAFLLAMVDGKLKFVVTTYNINGHYGNVPAFIHVPLTGWHMITLVSDFNSTTYAKITTRLYVDGILNDTVTEDDNPFSEGESGQFQHYNACTKFILGGEMKDYNYTQLDGTKLVIDNLRFYRSRMLTEEEIKTIYNSEKR